MRNPVHALFIVGVELLTSTESIVRQWKEYFEELLNPTITHSEEEAEPEDYGLGSLITGVEVAGAVKQLLRGTAPTLVEVRPELLKALDIVGLSSLICLCNITWMSGTVLLEWQTGVVFPVFKGEQRVCSNYWGITLLSLPGKIYSRVLDRRVWLLFKPWIQEEQ